jgi:hypothetical protein
MAEKPEPWQYSHAKEVLDQYILEGKVTANSDPHTVYLMNEEFKQYDEKRFKSNLKSLLKSIEKKEALAKFDLEALAHDQAHFPRPETTVRGYPFWDTSEARTLLAKDVDDDVDLTLTPRQLWNSREEYQAFPIVVFRQHIHQERYQREQSSYWLSTKKNGKKKEYWG